MVRPPTSWRHADAIAPTRSTYRARESPDQDFARQGARRLSYGEAVAAANQTAHALIEHGVGEGDRVAILAKNSLEYLLLYLGAAKAGAVTVPINYRLAPPEWRYILADSGARICFVGPEFVDGVNERRGDLATVEHALVVGGEPPAGWESYTDWTAAAPATAPDRRVDGRPRRVPDVHQRHHRPSEGRRAHSPSRDRQPGADRAGVPGSARRAQPRGRAALPCGDGAVHVQPLSGGVGPWSSSSSSIRSRSCGSSTKNASGSP